MCLWLLSGHCQQSYVMHGGVMHDDVMLSSV